MRAKPRAAVVWARRANFLSRKSLRSTIVVRHRNNRKIESDTTNRFKCFNFKKKKSSKKFTSGKRVVQLMSSRYNR